MFKLLISSCLLGNNVTYKGSNNLIKDIDKLKTKFEFIPVCPEVMGGLPIPRIPSERFGNIVISKQGVNVSKQYEKGKNIVIDLAKKYNIKYALLKANSPACGKNEIYDGTFTHTLIKRSGVTAEALMSIGVKVYNENEIDKLLFDIE